MTCDEARSAFSDLYDGALSGEPLVALDRHLEGCAACRAEWVAFRRTIQAMADLGSAEPLPGFAARVRQQIEAPPWWRRAAETLFFPVHVKVPIQALGLVLVAFSAVMIFQRSPELKRQAELPAPPPQPAAQPFGAVALRPPAERAEGPAPAAPPPSAPAPQARLEADKDRIEGYGGRADAGAPGAGAPAQPRPSLAPQVPGVTAPRPAPPPLSLAQPAAPGEGGSTAFGTRAPAPAREEAKLLDKAAPPVEAEKAAEMALKNKTRELESAMGRGLQSAPAPADARGKIAQQAPEPPGTAAPAAPPPAKAEAPAQAKEGQVASLRAASADELYSVGLTEFARQSYDQAIEAFRAFLAQNPRDARAPDARFWLADSYFSQQRYAEAIPEYDAVIRQFPDSRRVPAAILKQAQARLALGDQAGCQLLRDLAGGYPRAREAAQARETLAARCP